MTDTPDSKPTRRNILRSTSAGAAGLVLSSSFVSDGSAQENTVAYSTDEFTVSCSNAPGAYLEVTNDNGPFLGCSTLEPEDNVIVNAYTVIVYASDGTCGQSAVFTMEGTALSIGTYSVVSTTTDTPFSECPNEQFCRFVLEPAELPPGTEPCQFGEPPGEEPPDNVQELVGQAQQLANRAQQLAERAQDVDSTEAAQELVDEAQQLVDEARGLVEQAREAGVSQSEVQPIQQEIQASQEEIEEAQ